MEKQKINNVSPERRSHKVSSTLVYAVCAVKKIKQGEMKNEMEKDL